MVVYIGKMMDKELLAERAGQALNLGASVEIVGAWVWARFETKPDEATRTELKGLGFHWNQKRKVWQWAGRPAAGSPLGSNALRAKYGAFEVDKEKADFLTSHFQIISIK